MAIVSVLQEQKQWKANSVHIHMLSVGRELLLGSKFLLWLAEASDCFFLHFIWILETQFFNSLVIRESTVSVLDNSSPVREYYTNSSHFYLSINISEIVFQSVPLITEATLIIILQQLLLWISNHLKRTKMQNYFRKAEDSKYVQVHFYDSFNFVFLFTDNDFFNFYFLYLINKLNSQKYFFRVSYS